MDFAEIKPPTLRYKYMLILLCFVFVFVFFVNTSGQVEAYPTRTETASRFGLPVIIGSDNSPAFVARYPKP